jgi:hypothetical protein
MNYILSGGVIRQVPPHPSPLPEGRGSARTIRGVNSGVLSPLGERDRVRGDSVKRSTGYDITVRSSQGEQFLRPGHIDGHLRR